MANTHSSGQDELSDELSFEQQQDITKILELYRANPSNSNKYRFELFAKINSIISHHTQEAVESRREAAKALLEDLYRHQAFGKDCSYCSANSYTLLNKIAALASTNQPKVKERP